MKYFFCPGLLLLILIHIRCSACQADTVKVFHLSVLDNRVTETLKTIYAQEKGNYDWARSVFVIKTEKHKNALRIKVSIFYKEDFAHYLRNKKDKIFGYFEFDDNRAIVFGADSKALFLPTKESVLFVWLQPLPKNKYKGKVNPLVIFEPEGRIYEVREDEIILVEKGIMEILK